MSAHSSILPSCLCTATLGTRTSHLCSRFVQASWVIRARWGRRIGVSSSKQFIIRTERIPSPMLLFGRSSWLFHPSQYVSAPAEHVQEYIQRCLCELNRECASAVGKNLLHSGGLFRLLVYESWMRKTFDQSFHHHLYCDVSQN